MEDINIQTVEEGNIGVETTTPTYAADVSIIHDSLAGRNDPNQHEVAAITGLPKRLKELESARASFESSETGHANYHIWDSTVSTDDKKSGIFVTCNNEGHIKPCTEADGEDIFGVTVSSAAFIGGQTPANVNDSGEDDSVKRGSGYGLVVTNGFVYVRCATDTDVAVGDVVVAGADGLAVKKTDIQHGNKVVALKDIEGVKYAKIYLGLSPKQAVDIAGDVKVLQSEMISAQGNIGNMQTDINTLTGRTDTLEKNISTNVTITGGTIGGWGVNESGFEKTIGEHKAIMNSAADADSYVFGVVQPGDTDIWKFGVKTNGEVDIAKAVVDEGSIGGWTVNKDGFKIEKAFTDVCAVNGVWIWNDTFTFDPDDGNIEQNINFTVGAKSFEKLQFSTATSSGEMSYIGGSDIIAYDGNKWNTNYQSVNFGTTLQYVSQVFYNFLENNATRGIDATSVYQGEVKCTAMLNNNIENIDDKIFEVQNDIGEPRFYVQANGIGYISNAEYAEVSHKSEGAPAIEAENLYEEDKGKAFTFQNQNGFGIADDAVKGYFALWSHNNAKEHLDDSYYCHLIPSTQNTQCLGSEDHRFHSVYCQHLVLPISKYEGELVFDHEYIGRPGIYCAEYYVDGKNDLSYTGLIFISDLTKSTYGIPQWTQPAQDISGFNSYLYYQDQGTNEVTLEPEGILMVGFDQTDELAGYDIKLYFKHVVCLATW